MEKLMFCRNCTQSLLKQFPSQLFCFSANQRCISTSISLQKRQQRRYQPRVRPFWEYGATHRFMRGLNVEGDRYGLLRDRPDYTFLDGRPTPLTPEQTEERIKRVEIAKRVMAGVTRLDRAKDFSRQKLEEIEQKERDYSFPLKAKS